MQFFIDLQDGKGPRAIDATRVTLAQALELMAPLNTEIRLVRHGRSDVPKHDPRSRDLITNLSMGDRFRADEMTIVCTASELTEELLKDPMLKWNLFLFKLVEDVNWGDDNVATRIQRCFEKTRIEFVAQTLLVRKRISSYTIEQSWRTFRPIPQATNDSFSCHVMNYGPKCHNRVIETLNKLGIDPNLDLTDFPWEKL